MSNLLVITLISILLNACDYFQEQRFVEMKIKASANLNPDINERPSPILINFFELKDKIPFKNLEFTKISYNSYRYLKNTLIDSSTIEIQPGENKMYLKKINNGTHYLGIVAAYQAIDASHWKQIIEIPKQPRNLKINLMVDSLQIKSQRLN